MKRFFATAALGAVLAATQTAFAAQDQAPPASPPTAAPAPPAGKTPTLVPPAANDDDKKLVGVSIVEHACFPDGSSVEETYGIGAKLADVKKAGGVFATPQSLGEALNKVWQQVGQDVADGTVKADPKNPELLKADVDKYLKELADEIEQAIKVPVIIQNDNPIFTEKNPVCTAPANAPPQKTPPASSTLNPYLGIA